MGTTLVRESYNNLSFFDEQFNEGYKTYIKDKVKNIVLDYIDNMVNEFGEEAGYMLEMCEEENEFHSTVYWVDGTYEEIMEFIKDNYKLYGETLAEVILELYGKVGDINKLEAKVKGNFSTGSFKTYLAYEALATLILKEYQRDSAWYTVYGCEHEDMCDLQSKNTIFNALEDQEEFPVLKMSDVVAAMYGITTTVQEPTLYDIFAHKADALTPKENTFFTDMDNEPIWTPDFMQYDAVVGRAKYFADVKKECKKNKKRGIQLKLFDNGEDKLISVLNELGEITPIFKHYADRVTLAATLNKVKEMYMYRFGTPPYAFPITERNFDIQLVENNNKLLFHVKYNMMGICQGRTEWREIYNKQFSIPSENDIELFTAKLALDIKKVLAGVEKKDHEEAIGGLYPRKDLATHGLKLKGITLNLAEKQSLYIIKKTLRHFENPEVSCSFGMDSTLVTHLTRRVTKKGFKLLWNKTTVEYAETNQFADWLINEWDMKDQFVKASSKSTYWDYFKKYGPNLDVKGSRKVKDDGTKASNSERCCELLKHAPTREAIQQFQFDGGYSGLRADESRNRELAGKRDGVAYTSKSWGHIRVNPIIFFSTDMVKQYREKHTMPYNKIYDMVLYDEYGNTIYAPRVGCWPCLLTARHGYLRWLKNYKPKQFWWLMRDAGVGEILYRKSLGLEAPAPKKEVDQQSMFESDLNNNDDVYFRNIDIEWEQLEYLLNVRPCQFEKALA